MDLDDVVDLANNAAESVLRFQVVAFKSRAPFIDIKVVKSIVSSAIMQLAKKYHNDDHAEFVALMRITALSGDAAFRAATEWNSLSDLTNHIQPEWFRSCVCELVSGAVNDVAASAGELFQRVPTRDAKQTKEYLDPSGDLLMLDSCRDTGKKDDKALNDYYGFKQEDRQQSSVQQEDYSRPIDSIKSAWQAINRYSASPFSSTASAKCQATLASMNSKRIKDHEINEYEDIEEGKQGQGEYKNDLRHNLSHSRRSMTHRGFLHQNKMPFHSCKASNKPVLMPRSGNVHPPKTFWTKQEEIILVNARHEGKTWSAIHELLGHRTIAACEKKYRDLNTLGHHQQYHGTPNTETRQEEPEDEDRATDDESEEEEVENDMEIKDDIEGF